MSNLRPVLLSGGSGTRLWPLSTPAIPKQFVPLVGGRSLFELTLSRLAGLADVGSAVVVAGAAHVDLVNAALSKTGETAHLVVEPVGRNTAPAAIAAAMVCEPDDVMVILPADHLIADDPGFGEAVTRAAAHAIAGSIVTFGVVPTRPETGYGYIEVGDPVDDAFTVRRFKEKPKAEEADDLSSDGRHLWNSGMFVTRAGVLLDECGRYCPEVLDGVASAMPGAGVQEVDLAPSFAEVQAISIDHAVMEKTTRAVVVPIDVGWSDIGSYRALLSALDKDEHGNHLAGGVTVEDVTGSFVTATSRRVVVAGLSDVVVVETPDAVLVLPLDRSQDVGEISKRAESR